MKKMGAKAIVVALAGVLAIGGAVGGTLAWLMDKTNTVTNTFTAGNVDITLEEKATGDAGGKQFKMVPGNKITKDPIVTVEAGSEACWLFVQVNESLGSWAADGKSFKSVLSYEIADGWTAVPGAEGVYYIKVDKESAASGKEYHVLKGDAVTVSTAITKDDMDILKNATATKPTLTFTAYAIQQENVATEAADDDAKAAVAWGLAKTQS